MFMPVTSLANNRVLGRQHKRLRITMIVIRAWAALGEQRAGFRMAGRRQPVQPPPGPVLPWILIFPPAADPADLLEPA
jgi:hypothetical protein